MFITEALLGGIAGMFAAVLSNPIEVVKVRMQLQGKLQTRGQNVVYYKNMIHAAYVIARNDGILALQNGIISYFIHKHRTCSNY